MHPPGWIIAACWIAFIIFWRINAFTNKSTIEPPSVSSTLAYRLPALIGSILLFAWRLPEAWNQQVITPADWMRYTGAAVCVTGLAVCIWARVTLAGNWSSNVTFKQNHELIRTGPYRFARHPIYTGLLLMALGHTLAVGELRCLLGLALWLISFWIKLKQEEKLMLQHFPDQYPIYRQQVKALVPFVI